MERNIYLKQGNKSPLTAKLINAMGVKLNYNVMGAKLNYSVYA
jgi:hypothetical protein